MDRSDSVFLVWGAGGHASVVDEIIEQRFSEAALIRHYVSDEPETLEAVISKLVAGRPDIRVSVVLAVGDNCVRSKLLTEVQRLSVPHLLPVIYHPKSIISPSAVVGDGTHVCAGAVINAGASVGEAVIVNTNAIVEHDCVVGTASHVSPGGVLAGGVTVGERTWIGAGAVVREGVTIGNDSIVGAGAVVLEDVPDGVVTVGVPARIIRDRDSGNH